jgi:(p)ppGpp synthase/HD superfamily hydrolase
MKQGDALSKTDNPFLTDRFDDALAYARRIHRDQQRKGSGIPYVSPLLAVAAVALENGADEDQAIAALLHDAVEDQGGLPRLEKIRARFGDDVAGMVAD